MFATGEAETMEFDNGAVCRLCDKLTNDLVSIFSKNAAGHQIIQLIKKCFPIIIYRSDPLSKFICADCSDNVYNFHTFKKLVDDVTIQQKSRLELQTHSKSTRLYLNSLQESEDDATSYTDIPRSDQSTSTDDFCPVKSADVDSLLDIDCSSYTDNDGAVNGNNDDIANDNDNEMDADNDNEESDMDIEEDSASRNSIIESKKRLATSSVDSEAPPTKRLRPSRHIVGPKCAKQAQAEASLVSDNPAVKLYQRVYYEPHSLMQTCLNLINSVHVPDYHYERCRKVVETVEEMQNYCEDCETEFETELELVKHENCRELQLLVHRVDDIVYWPATNRDHYIRNLWLQDLHPDSDIPEPEDDLLIPLTDTVPSHATTNQSGHNVVTYLGEKPYINGVPLGSIGKKDRLYVYQTIRIQNIQRKFCTECRFTFKDNWAMDKHYMTLACLYTCRYCGRRFNSMRQVFDAHVQMHVESGHAKSEKIFATNKRNDPNPRVINAATVRFLSPQQVVSKRGNRFYKSLNHLHKVFEQPTLRPVKLKHLLRAPSRDDDIKIKGEPSNGESTVKRPTPNSQAYFCKKCYKVFFKLDEYNSHTATVCLGGGGTGGEDPPMVTVPGHTKRPYNRQPKITPAEVARKIAEEQQLNSAGQGAEGAEGGGNSVFSPTGRPVRHCVREVRTYNDDVDRIETPPPHHAAPMGRFSCGICASVFPNIHSRNSHMRIHKTGLKQFGAIAAAAPPQPPGLVPAVVSTAAAASAQVVMTGAGGGGGGGGPPPLRAGPHVLQQQVQRQRQRQMMLQQQQQQQQMYGSGGGLAQKIVNSLRQQKQAHQQLQHQQAQLQQAARHRQLEATYQSTLNRNQVSSHNTQQHNIGSASRPVLHRPRLIKEEPIEPLVEIHEDEEEEALVEEEMQEEEEQEVVMEVEQYPSNIGSVSITPIVSRRQRSTGNSSSSQQSVRPDIMRLVQNNPHLSIKPKGNNNNTPPTASTSSSSSSSNRGSSVGMMMTMNNGGTPRRQYGTGPHAIRTQQQHAQRAAQLQLQQQQLQQQLMQQQMAAQAAAAAQQVQLLDGQGGSPPDADKMYRCSSCNNPFANKSHLYFHKKNQCGGSKYPCPFCKKRFGTEAAYSSHIFYSHPI